MKARRAVDLDVPSAAPCEATLKDRRAADPEATVKDRRAAERSFALAAASELTIRERAEWPTWRASERPAQAELPILNEPAVKEWSAAEAIINKRNAADRYVPPAAPFEPTLKERSATARSVPPPVSPASERPTGWLTWWLTSCPNASSALAEPPIVPLTLNLKRTSAANARPRITRSAPTWIVLMVLVVAAAAGTVAFISRSTNGLEHVQPSSTHTKALDDDATKALDDDATKATKAAKPNAIGGAP